ncbi:MAG TPA: carboxypeptidase-like regulatory domain-containing protein, partial [Pyrinomonadaceae bacterium]|nr:carboxypeptidase-like regulatory domain-containing protein [Pyrinomonadaceae bacterium]
MKTMILRVQLIILFSLLVARTAAGQQPSPTPFDDTIRGRVVNEAGQPISGVSISLNAMGGSLGQRTNTDSE